MPLVGNLGGLGFVIKKMSILYKVYHLMYVTKLSCTCRKRRKGRRKEKQKEKEKETKQKKQS